MFLWTRLHDSLIGELTGGVWGCVCADAEDSLWASCGWIIGHSGKGCGGTTPLPSVMWIVVSFDPGILVSQPMNSFALGRIYIFSLVLDLWGLVWCFVLMEILSSTVCTSTRFFPSVFFSSWLWSSLYPLLLGGCFTWSSLPHHPVRTCLFLLSYYWCLQGATILACWEADLGQFMLRCTMSVPNVKPHCCIDSGATVNDH